MKTYAILEGNMDRVMAKINRIRRKCRKYGCDFHFAEVGEEFREVKNEDGTTKTCRFVLVEAEGVAEINGWKFVASVEHTEKGNIISKACDIEVPEAYYNTTPVCEHCMSKRYRKDTFVIVNTETGEFKQVGRKCLADYTHGMNAEAVAAYAAMFDEIISAEEPTPGSSLKTYMRVEEVLRYAAETVRHFGYVKSGGFDRGTSDRTLDYYGVDHGWFNGAFDAKRRRELREEMEKCGFDSESTEASRLVKDALDYLSRKDESNNYMHNLKTVCALSWCETKHVGLLASLFPTYNKGLEIDQAKRKAQEAAKASNWVGENGRKIEVNVADIKVITSWETQWGITKIYKITDDHGNVLTWKTSSWINEDRITKISGTVKDHTEFRGEKQTELTRCKCQYAPKKREAYSADAEEAVGVFCKACDAM